MFFKKDLTVFYNKANRPKLTKALKTNIGPGFLGSTLYTYLFFPFSQICISSKY